MKYTNRKINNNNIKKILCHHIVTTNHCSYGDKCMYAHSLEEQVVDDDRKYAFEILTSNKKLSHIDLHENIQLYRSLLSLTRLCSGCIDKTCTGGINCKYGACLKKYHICINDLHDGNCNEKCGSIHLTLRGLKPLYKKSSSENLSNDDDMSDLSIDSIIEQQYDEFEESIFEC